MISFIYSNCYRQGNNDQPVTSLVSANNPPVTDVKPETVDG